MSFIRDIPLSYSLRNSSRFSSGAKTVAVVGGGFSGTVFALKLAAAHPGWTIFLAEDNPRLGLGLAYGACAPMHLLNVPVSRMEVGLTPSFATWLGQRRDALIEALAESCGQLKDAFVPRHLFGAYLEERIAAALSSGRTGIHHLRSSAVRISPEPRRLTLADGRIFPVDIVVLAPGNLPAAFPVKARPSKRIIADPWAADALQPIEADTPLLIVGSGLTMVDTVLALRARGHTGRIDVVSRHGLVPRAHRAGGAWPSFTDSRASPVEALRTIRRAIGEASAKNIPWQRVFDAVRPAVASLWESWSIGQRAQFLRHLRVIWDVHRHRMAERIATSIDALIEAGTLHIRAGRILAIDEHEEGVTAVIRPQRGRATVVEVGAVINCTGPRTDLRETSHPLLKNLLSRGLIRSDPLGLGLESEDSAVRGATDDPSDWLYALGPLTRPAWWEITAVPEITAQIDRLVEKLSSADFSARPLAEVFLDMGAGI